MDHMQHLGSLGLLPVGGKGWESIPDLSHLTIEA